LRKFALRKFAFVLVVFACVILGGCKNVEEILTININAAGAAVASVEVRVAASKAQQERGLMFEESLEDGKGMLFIFDTVKIRSFWMKDTSIPLSIAFIAKSGDNFVITEIYDLTPFDETFISSSLPCIWALEVPQGYFQRAGILIGDCVIKV
jgi:uncharacterized membrane protein (UPF0127 family)